MTTATRPLVCRHCGDHLTPIPGGWIGPDDWESCRDTGTLHDPTHRYIKICWHCFSNIHLSDPGCVWVDDGLRETCGTGGQRHQPTIVDG